VVTLSAAANSDTLQIDATNVGDQIEAQSVGGTDQVVLDTMGLLQFFSFGNLHLVGEFGNDQFLVGTMPGVNVTITGSGGQAGGGGFYNVLNFDPHTQAVTLTPTSINVQGAPPVSISGISQINFLNSVADVSALVKLLSVGKAKRVSKNRIKIHLTIEDLSAIALGGPLALIFSALTGRAQVVGLSGLTMLFTPAGVGLPWVMVNEGAIPRISSGEQIGFDVVFRTTHSHVSFNPFFVIASRLP
jgi:hypothetical protein